jgi:isopentenyl diphosphate isomerase/L-lactate dehydrogenase-like FMN-dependent dehydrogenase
MMSGNKTTVLFDSGVRTASDAFEDLGLGTKFVFVTKRWIRCSVDGACAEANVCSSGDQS